MFFLIGAQSKRKKPIKKKQKKRAILKQYVKASINAAGSGAMAAILGQTAAVRMYRRRLRSHFDHMEDK